MDDWDFTLWDEELTRQTLDTFSGGAIDWGDDELAATHLCVEWADEMRRLRRNGYFRYFHL